MTVSGELRQGLMNQHQSCDLGLEDEEEDFVFD